MSDGQRLRRERLAARDGLSGAEIQAKSESIRQRLLTLPEILGCTHCFVYVSFRSEVVTLGIIDDLLKNGKQVSVPLTLVKEKRLDIIRLVDREADLVPGYCGIPEPKPEILSSRRVQAETIDCIILPGSVFDERGGRFGYGGGYYDRLLASVPAARRIGLAFDVQMVEKAPLADHDELLDIVVTESRIIHGSR